MDAEPRAATARYDRQLDRVIVDLTNGCTFAFPPRIAQGLETATADQLAKIEILGVGYGLHWESLNVDLSLPGLMAGRFGSKAYMAQSAPSCDFGQVGERFGNVAFGIDDGNHRRGQFAPS